MEAATDSGQPERPAAEDQQRTENLTDVGNGERLVRNYGDRLRYIAPWKEWLAWDGKRWRRGYETRIERYAKWTIRRMYREASRLGDDARRRLVEWARESEAAPRIAAMIKMARSEPAVELDHESLDRNAWLLNCPNGTVDLQTGELRRHRRADLITKICPTPYDPAAECPIWNGFLNRIMAGKQDLIGILRRAAGYSLTGSVREQLLFFCYGRGANGKSTFLVTLQNILGPDYAMQAPHDFIMAAKGDRHPTELADLFGKRFVSTIETDEGRKMAEAMVKQITGGDRIRARGMRENFWEFQPTHKLWLASNHKPRIEGIDEGIWRRIKQIPFTVTIPQAERDNQLLEKLAAEMPGILAWAVRGCIEWQRDGLGTTKEVDDAAVAYRAEQDRVGQFVNERCVLAPNAKVSMAELFSDYCRWCEARGDKQETPRKLGAYLRDERELVARRGTGGAYVWEGIGLLVK